MLELWGRILTSLGQLGKRASNYRGSGRLHDAGVLGLLTCQLAFFSVLPTGRGEKRKMNALPVSEHPKKREPEGLSPQIWRRGAPRAMWGGERSHHARTSHYPVALVSWSTEEMEGLWLSLAYGPSFPGPLVLSRGPPSHTPSSLEVASFLDTDSCGCEDSAFRVIIFHQLYSIRVLKASDKAGFATPHCCDMVYLPSSPLTLGPSVVVITKSHFLSKDTGEEA